MKTANAPRTMALAHTAALKLAHRQVSEGFPKIAKKSFYELDASWLFVARLPTAVDWVDSGSAQAWTGQNLAAHSAALLRDAAKSAPSPVRSLSALRWQPLVRRGQLPFPCEPSFRHRLSWSRRESLRRQRHERNLHHAADRRKSSLRTRSRHLSPELFSLVGPLHR